MGSDLISRTMGHHCLIELRLPQFRVGCRLEGIIGYLRVLRRS